MTPWLMRFLNLPAVKSKTGLECPVCLGSPNLHPRVKSYSYYLKDTLQRHFETHNLPETFPGGRECDCPGCDIVLYSLPVYMHHQASKHGILL